MPCESATGGDGGGVNLLGARGKGPVDGSGVQACGGRRAAYEARVGRHGRRIIRSAECSAGKAVDRAAAPSSGRAPQQDPTMQADGARGAGTRGGQRETVLGSGSGSGWRGVYTKTLSV